MKFIAIASLLTLLSACTKETRPARTPTGGNQGQTTRSQAAPAGPNWAAMAARVRNSGARQEQALSLLDEAVSEYEHYKRGKKAGSEDRTRLEKAQKLHEKANNIDDMLREDVFEIAGSDDMGEKLWNQRFRNYQNKWDRLSKKVSRIQFK